MKKTYRLYLLTILFFISFSRVHAQNTGNWSLVGPNLFPTNSSGQINGIGRVPQMKFHPSSNQKIYAISATGGLFVSTNGAQTWNVTGTDNLFKTNTASICIDYTNDQILYLGTGDPNYYSTYYGIYKSIDGGNNWTASNSGIGNRLAVEILMSPTNNNILIAATNDGIWKSTDAGATWTVKKSGGDFTDMNFKPGDANIVYAATHTQFFRSTDQGNTWTLVAMPGLGFANGGRIGVTNASPSTVFVTFAGDFPSATATPVLKSTDNGATFSVVHAASAYNLNGYDENSNGQGNYNYDITVDPSNANIVYIASHVVWKSTDGGVTWTRLTNWYQAVHTDMHQIIVSPYDNTKLYNANDGGVWLSTDGGTNWITQSDGLACSEIYHAAQSPIRKDMIDIGTQDNGELNYTNNTWYTNGGGDFGGKIAFDYQNNTDVYHLGNDRTRKRMTGGGAPGLNLPFAAGDGNGNDVIIEFNASQTLTSFVAKSDVYRTSNVSVNNPTWTQITSINTQIMAMASSPADANILYVVANNNTLYRSDNALAAIPTFVGPITTPGATNVCASIEGIKNDANIVYMTCGNRAYRSADKGATWTNISAGLPTVNIIALYHDIYTTDESVYVGMATGVYYRNTTLGSWNNFSTGLPTIASINEFMMFNDGTVNSRLRVGFFGRGVWESSLYNNTLSFVTITNPLDGAVFSPGSNITINATAFAGSGKTISKVEFYSGTNLIGTSNIGPYSIIWNAVPEGVYTLTAKAYDNTGNVTSTIITIHVSPIGTTVFQDCNYGGYSAGLIAGDYTLSQLQALGVSNDDISSVRVAVGYKVILYSDDNFQGTTVTLTADNSCLVGLSFNDITSSIRVIKITTVPVEWLDFTALKKEAVTVLNWSTTSETNSDQYNIERSLDGQQFETIGKVKAAGNSTAVSYYTFEDKEISDGIVYYRIKQIDFNGAFKYSLIIHIENTSKGFLASNFPNPFDEFTTINFELEYDGPVEIVLYSMQGLKAAEVFNGTLKKGTQSIELDARTHNLAEGKYICKIVSADKTYSLNLIKVSRPKVIK